jgi:hypothetical protein
MKKQQKLEEKQKGMMVVLTSLEEKATKQKERKNKSM